jgi:hypothetical protein
MEKKKSAGVKGTNRKKGTKGQGLEGTENTQKVCAVITTDV